MSFFLSPMPDINWEQIARNGQLVWEHVEQHRVMLERFYAFWKGTSDEIVIKTHYPKFYQLQKDREQAETAPTPVVVTVTEVPAEQPIVEAVVEPKKSVKRRKSSPPSDARIS
jgi:hypothetical protein